MKKTIVIMTKSSKITGFCVAGIDIQTGEWIRLVSDDEIGEGAVALKDMIYQDGTEMQILDVVTIECLDHVPTDAQCENYLYDSRHYWQKIGKYLLDDVFELIECQNKGYVFENTNKFLEEFEVTGESLLLVSISDIALHVSFNPYKNKNQYRIDFTYNNKKYNDFSVSDIKLKNRYKSVGDYLISGEHYAVFSLTGEFKGKCYKMLAQLF